MIAMLCPGLVITSNNMKFIYLDGKGLKIRVCVSEHLELLTKTKLSQVMDIGST